MQKHTEVSTYSPALMPGVSRLDTDTAIEGLPQHQFTAPLSYSRGIDAPAIASCPHCHMHLGREDLQPRVSLLALVAHALIDHFLAIETELAELRRLEEVVL